jgi:hypothetical protein
LSLQRPSPLVCIVWLASLPIAIAVIYRYANVVANSNRLAEAFITADYYKLTGSTI